MGLLTGLAKIVLSPLRGVDELILDAQEKNSEEETGVAIVTLGASSIIKGTAKGISEGVQEIFKE